MSAIIYTISKRDQRDQKIKKYLRRVFDSRSLFDYIRNWGVRAGTGIRRIPVQSRAAVWDILLLGHLDRHRDLGCIRFGRVGDNILRRDNDIVPSPQCSCG